MKMILAMSRRTKQEQPSFIKSRGLILRRLQTLKRHPGPAWKDEARTLIAALEKLEDPYGELEYHGSEATGRHASKVNRCPSFDRMDDNSRP